MSQNSNKGLIGDLFQNTKYRPVLVSLGALLVALTAVLLATYYLVRQAENATERMDLIGDFSDEVLFVTIETQHLATLDSPQQKTAAIARLQQHTAAADVFMDELAGQDQTAHHDHEGALASLNAHWQQYKNRLATLTSNSTTDTLNALANFSHQQQTLIYDGITVSYDEYYDDSVQMTNYARYAQILAFIGLLLFLVVFVGYALTRMRLGDVLLENAQKETTDILKTVNEGLFLINQELVLSGQYSHSLERILDRDDLQGRRLDELLQGAISQKDLNATKLFIDQLYNPWVVEELIQDLNPLKQIKVSQLDADGVPYAKYLSFDFLRVSDDEDTVNKVFVSVTDVTDTVLLQEGLERVKLQHERELEMISTILAVDTKHLLYFVDNTTRRIEQMNDILKSNAQDSLLLNQKAQTLFREMHSLKGDASALKLEAFVTIAEQQELTLKRLIDKAQLSGDDFLGFTVGLDELLELNLYIKGLLTRLRILSGNIDTVASQPAPLRWQAYFEEYAQDIATRHDKKVQVQVMGFDEWADDDRFNMYKDIAVQFLKNAIVHGIETPSERLVKGKPEAGVVNLSLQSTDGTLCLSVYDDGAGIDNDKLRQQAITMGYVSPDKAQTLNQKQLYALMLKSGLSTADTQDEDAGRGVGMSVVYELATKAGGRLQIRSEPERHTQMVVSFG